MMSYVLLNVRNLELRWIPWSIGEGQENQIMIVDSYATACFNCKYIKNGLAKLVAESGVQEIGGMCFKHNIITNWFSW